MLLTVLGIFFFTPKETYAQTVLFQDNFDDNNISDWTVARSKQWSNPSQPCMYLGNPQVWFAENGKMINRLTGLSCITEITPNNFTIPPSISYVYEVDMTMPSSIVMDRNFIFKYKDGNNWYGVHTYGENVYIHKVVNGTEYFIPNWRTTYKGFVANQTYHFKVVYSRERIQLYINDILITDSIDPITQPTFDNFTAGLQASSGAPSSTEVWFDNVVIKELEPPFPILAVVNWKQYMAPWATETYDHANLWSSNPTIRKYGCAVTSAAMVLKYFKHDVYPHTLNDWLKEHKGYLRNGSLIWTAISRFSLEHMTADAPKLELTIHSPTNTFLADSLKNSLPIILRLPDPLHFIVARGQTAGDFLVNDPNSEVNDVLSKSVNIHGSPNQAYKFTPANSDLSYMVFAVNPNITMEVFDEDGNKIEGLVTTESAPRDAENNQPLNAEDLKVFWYPQPPYGNYILQLSGSGSYQLDSYLYNTEGEVTDNSFNGTMQEGDLNTFNIVVEQSPTIAPAVSFDSILEDLEAAYNQELISNQGIYKSLRAQVVSAKRLNDQGKVNLAKLVLRVVALRIRIATPKFVETDISTDLQTKIATLIHNI